MIRVFGRKHRLSLCLAQREQRVQYCRARLQGRVRVQGCGAPRRHRFHYSDGTLQYLVRGRIDYEIIHPNHIKYEIRSVAWPIKSTLRSSYKAHTLHVNTDSQTPFRACQFRHYITKNILRIEQLCKTGPSDARTKIIMHWVPGRTGIGCNDKACEAAVVIDFIRTPHLRQRNRPTLYPTASIQTSTHAPSVRNKKKPFHATPRHR